jgi:hypothetical protein
MKLHRHPLPGFVVGILVLLMATSALAASSKATKKKSAYGAIAWHRESGSVGYSYDYTSARLAGTEALRQCGHPKCEVVLPLHNECGALASSAKGFAARRGHTQAEAQTKAANACGTDCRPVAWACTR